MLTINESIGIQSLPSAAEPNEIWSLINNQTRPIQLKMYNKRCHSYAYVNDAYFCSCHGSSIVMQAGIIILCCIHLDNYREISAILIGKLTYYNYSAYLVGVYLLAQEQCYDQTTHSCELQANYEDLIRRIFSMAKHQLLSQQAIPQSCGLHRHQTIYVDEAFSLHSSK